MKKKLCQKSSGISLMALAAFLVSITFCSLIISATIVNRVKFETLSREELVNEKINKINEIINYYFYKTQVLSAMVIHDNGRVDSFDELAPYIADNPVVQNVTLAPHGIVSKVYPYNENKELIGLNYYGKQSGNEETLMAIKLKELVLCGPIDDMHGGSVICGRLPVFISTPEGKQTFWGIVNISLDFSRILEQVEFDAFNNINTAYELWRVHPETSEKDIMADSSPYIVPDDFCIEKPINLHNAQWFLRVSPTVPWYNQIENIVLIVSGLLIGIIVFFVVQNNYHLKNMQGILRTMAITDPLTDIFNRRYFMDFVNINIKKAEREKEVCYLIMIDIDHFKDINDRYGHQIGDKVLIELTRRIKFNIRPYDVFARYGGEEFVIYTSKISCEEIKAMTERLRLSLCSRKFQYNNISFNISASFGIAMLDDYNIELGIKRADDALYAAKENGRNRACYYGDSDFSGLHEVKPDDV